MDDAGGTFKGPCVNLHERNGLNPRSRYIASPSSSPDCDPSSQPRLEPRRHVQWVRPSGTRGDESSCRQRDARSMTRPILFVGAARAISLLLGVVLLGLLGRRLGPGGFGTLQFALALMVYPSLLVDLGLTTFGLREIARGIPSITVIPTIISARLLISIGVVILAATAILFLPMDAETKWISLVLTLGLPGLALNSRWVLQGERQFGRAALLDVVTTGTQLLAAMALVAGPGDTLWAATALTLATWVTSITSILVAGRWDRFRPHVDRRLPTVIHQGIPLGAAAVAIAIYYSVDTVLLGVFRSAEEVAFYAAAYRVILPILALAGAVGIVAIPHLTLLATRDAAQANQATADISRWLMLLALPLAAGGSLAAGPIIRFIYGNEFAPAAAPFAVLVWSVVTVFANAAFAFLMLARRGDRRYLVAATAGAGTNFGLNLIAIPAAGMLGAAFTTILSEVIVLGCILYWTRDVSIKALIAGLRPPAVPTLAMCVILWPIS